MNTKSQERSNNTMDKIIIFLLLNITIVFLLVVVLYIRIIIIPFYKKIYLFSDKCVIVLRYIKTIQKFIVIDINHNAQKCENITKAKIIYKPLNSIFTHFDSSFHATIYTVYKTHKTKDFSIKTSEHQKFFTYRYGHIIYTPYNKIAIVYSIKERNETPEHTLKIIESAQYALSEILIKANVLNDDDTGEHLRRMGAFSTYLAYKYATTYNTVSMDFVNKIRIYAPLHDVGKIGLPDSLLKTPSRYTNEQRRLMQRHVVIGAQLLSDKHIDKIARNIALYHHERWNGSGYVIGLTGNQIPLEARIVMIADVWDSLIHKRVYKRAFSEEYSINEIVSNANILFDKVLVDLFFSDMDILRKINHETLFSIDVN